LFNTVLPYRTQIADRALAVMPANRVSTKSGAAFKRKLFATAAARPIRSTENSAHSSLLRLLVAKSVLACPLVLVPGSFGVLTTPDWGEGIISMSNVRRIPLKKSSGSFRRLTG